MEAMEEYAREGLAARLRALESAHQALRDGSPAAPESVRRIARSLCGAGGGELSEVEQAARHVVEAPEDHLGLLSHRLAEVIRQTTRAGPSRRLGILVIEDDPDMAHLLQSLLQRPNRTVMFAGTAAAGLELLFEKEVALIVLDLMLPDMDGRSLLVRIRESPRTAMVPVVILTARVGELTRTECLAIGADVFLEKPIIPEEFSIAVQSLLRRVGATRIESRVDALTGLPNRPAFREAFERTLALSGRTGMPVSVAMLDLDRFKPVNDLHGHGVGDEILRRVGGVIGRSLRQSDVLARWGGDEFVVLFPDTGRAGAIEALEAALASLQAERFPVPERSPISLSFSSGVVEVPPGARLEDAVIAADALLYRAKGAGKSRVEAAPPGRPGPARKILFAEDDPAMAGLVRRYLEREGFDVVHCSDGGQALAAAHEQPFSAVLLDILMPRMDGLEVLRRLRKMPGYSRVPILMFTAVGRGQDVGRAIDLGADDYVLKPFPAKELVTRIHRLLGTYESRISARGRGAAAVSPSVQDLVPQYLARRRNDVERVRQSLRERDFETIRRAGHDMKGSGSGYGHPDITRMGARIEESAGRQDAAAIGEAVDELEKYLLNA